MTVNRSKEPERAFKVTPVFKANWNALLNSERRYIVNEGGTRSGKTFSIMQVLLTYADINAGIRISVCSHSLPHLKRGALRDFETIAGNWGKIDDLRHNKTDNIFYFPNGSYIEFIGLEEPDKARGSSRDILFINEANLLSKALFDQLDIRTTGKVIIDLNPSDFDVWCYHLADGPEAVKIHSTYENNISNLPRQQVDLIESYKLADQNLWRVFGLGLRGTSEDQIYTHWRICENLPAKGECYYGLDFGYNVQTALVQVVTTEGTNYVKELIYETKLTTYDLIERMKGLGISKFSPIFADCAEPKSIEELYRAGYNVKPSDKDVTEGIRKVKSMPLFVTQDSTNIINELRSYKWKTDKNGKKLDEPIKERDHLCDAIRYAIFTNGLAFKFKVLVG